MLVELDEIEAEVQRLAARLDVGSRALPTFGKTEDGARPHIEVTGAGYHYVVVERGRELRRDTTTSLDELLYMVFAGVTFDLACRWEAGHRARGRDFRRVLFEKQVDLLATLSPEWARREADVHAEILRGHPFDDRADERARLAAELRGQGKSAEEAWELACVKVPTVQGEG
jgi:hypothetical protein